MVNEKRERSVQERGRFGFWWPLLLMVVPGVLGVVIFGYYCLIDWAALQADYAHYVQVAASTADLRAVFIAESQQNIHRINLFAEGVWALLAAILAAIGVHGIVQIRVRSD